MPTVIIPPPYRGPTDGAAQVEVAPGSVRECLDAVVERYPGFGELLFAEDGALQRFVSLFLNGDQIQGDALDKPVAAADELEIVAAIAGG